jgi:hypothetical protein
MFVEKWRWQSVSESEKKSNTVADLAEKSLGAARPQPDGLV